MYIDPHVHCRDGKQAYKETITHALSVAEHAGLTAIFDMPNTDPPITTEEHVLERLELADKANSPVYYGIYMALTANRKQIENAVNTYNLHPEVVGFKLFAGHSVGEIGIVEEDSQRTIYRTLGRLGYKGVVATHCEKENMIIKRKEGNKEVQDWNPRYPVTHAFARPPQAEVESVRDQITFAGEEGFEGILHIAHISVPEAVDLVEGMRKYRKITCGATPHHLLYSISRMEEVDGIWYKMNPPLRPKKMVNDLVSQLLNKKIDWIETDHAPHAAEEKLNEPYMSGIPLLHFYPEFVEKYLKSWLSKKQLEDMTYNNAYKTFFRPERRLVKREPVPHTSLRHEYDFYPS